jgi:hypothetical protein
MSALWPIEGEFIGGPKAGQIETCKTGGPVRLIAGLSNVPLPYSSVPFTSLKVVKHMYLAWEFAPGKIAWVYNGLYS